MKFLSERRRENGTAVCLAIAGMTSGKVENSTRAGLSGDRQKAIVHHLRNRPRAFLRDCVITEFGFTQRRQGSQRRGVLRADLDADEAGTLLLVIRLGLLASWFSDPTSLDLGSLTRSFIRVLLPALFSSKQVATKRLLRRRKTAEYDALTRLWLEQRGLSSLGFRRRASGPQNTRPKRTGEKSSYKPAVQ